MSGLRILLLGLVLLSLTACNFPKPTPTSMGPEVFYTAAAQTLQAQGTLVMGTAHPTITASGPTLTFPSATQLIATQLPPVTVASGVPCDRAEFVQDVTIPDDTQIQAGATFTKTWRLRNSGSCAWTPSYSIVFVEGNTLGAPASVPLTTTSVAPGQTVDVSVQMIAPTRPGTYQGDWKLRSSFGYIFGVGAKGDQTFWVRIEVVEPGG